MNIHNKILGCLVGAAAGDALGAATEMRTRQQIEATFNGPVRTFLAPPPDTFARGNKPGQVTDDFSLAYTSVRTILETRGRIDADTARTALLNWGQTPEFEKFAGPTTRAAIQELAGVPFPLKHGFNLVNDNSKASNGAAMKIAPIALFAKGDVNQAIEDAYQMARISHDNQLSISAACAIAAATAKAMQENVTINDLIEAGLYGARIGETLGVENAKTLAGPSVIRRIELALELGAQDKPLVEILDDLSDLIGGGLPAYEAVPCVFGILRAVGDDPEEAILAGVNIGNDTDTIATMVGGIVGAYHDIQALPADYPEVIDQANGYDLKVLAHEIEVLVYGA